MSVPTTQLHRWTRREYERMVNAGGFDPEARIELIEGDILNMTPQSSFHAGVVRLVEDALRIVFAHGHDVRSQMPLALGADSEPEPDIAVVAGSPRDHLRAHPGTAVLVVEVADSSLSLDRGRKKRLYARGGIPEYWIVNLVDTCLEVYRELVRDTYQSQAVFGPAETISPVLRPEASIAVADLLP